MTHESPHDSKKEKIRKRNLRNQIINMMARQHESVYENRELSAPPIDLDAKKKEEENTAVMSHVQMVRNRMTGKRAAMDGKWNRFAGTSGGGGRGR